MTPAPLAPSAVLPTLSFAVVGLPADRELKPWILDVKFSNTGVPVAKDTSMEFVAIPTGFKVVFQTVKLCVPHPESMLLVPQINRLFIPPDAARLALFTL
jgi:hypothetical protein